MDTEYVVKFIRKMGLSVTEAAKLAGMSTPSFSNYLHGKPMGKSIAKKWSAAFGFNPAWLIFNSWPIFLDDHSSYHGGSEAILRDNDSNATGVSACGKELDDLKNKYEELMSKYIELAEKYQKYFESKCGTH